MPILYIEQPTLAGVFGKSLAAWMNLGFRSEVYTSGQPAILKATFPSTPEAGGTIGAVLKRELLMGQIKKTDHPALAYIHFTRDIHPSRQGKGGFNNVFPHGLVICGDISAFLHDFGQGRSNLRHLPEKTSIAEVVERKEGFVPGVFKRYGDLEADLKTTAEKSGEELKIELPSAVLYARNEEVGRNL